jgi:hypothetical protein
MIVAWLARSLRNIVLTKGMTAPFQPTTGIRPTNERGRWVRKRREVEVAQRLAAQALNLDPWMAAV